MGAELNLIGRTSGQLALAERFSSALRTIEEANGESWALYRAGAAIDDIPELRSALNEGTEGVDLLIARSGL